MYIVFTIILSSNPSQFCFSKHSHLPLTGYSLIYRNSPSPQRKLKSIRVNLNLLEYIYPNVPLRHKNTSSNLKFCMNLYIVCVSQYIAVLIVSIHCVCICILPVCVLQFVILVSVDYTISYLYFHITS